jgi:uncharacterized protein (TIGR00255 family)
MIVSMTGFGDASTERAGTHYSVEIRSLNNRFFKSVIKLPDNVSLLEPELESTLRERLQRGSITYIVKMRVDSADAGYVINTAALDTYLRQLKPLLGTHGVNVDLAALLALPGVTQEAHDQSEELERHAPAIRDCTLKAIERLIAMREREGKALFDDLMKHSGVITSNLAEIAKRAPFVIDDYHKRLAQRVNQLIGKAELKFGEQDLLKEIALFAERADISEEIQRLSEHMRAFEHECRQGEHAGRKLDFITQEMLREANTIASKANDAQIARHIVEIKGAIDRLKEQVQNVE